MNIAGVTFPDNCPDKCPGNGDEAGSGALCARCPVFNCRLFDDDGKAYRLIEPENFSEEVAFLWRNWFDRGMRGSPEFDTRKVLEVKRQ